jgi:hypothetical protein
MYRSIEQIQQPRDQNWQQLQSIPQVGWHNLAIVPLVGQWEGKFGGVLA